MKYFYFIIFITFFFVKNTTAQILEKGLPFIKNYTASEYNAHPETWAVTQDKRGLMYFGNHEGVLEFDGVSWRLIKIPNKSIVKSLDCSNKGRVFVGAQGEIGYLMPNPQGRMVYVSLLDKIPKQHRNFGDVWQTFCTPNGGVWFRSPELIFLYKNNKVKVFAPSPNQSFHKAFFVNNNFYVREIGKGLLQYRNNKLSIVSEGGKFAEDRIYLMLDYGNNKLLVGSRKEGLMFYNGKSFKTWNIEVNKHIKENQIYGGISLDNNQYFAISNLQSGLLIMNRKGQVIQHINQEKGLLNDIVTDLITDKNGNLWLSSLSGISYVEINSDFGLLSEELGIKGTVYSSMLYQDDLFLGTTSGLYKKEWKKYSNPIYQEENQFTKIPNTDGQALDLAILKDKLLIGHYQGLLSWDGQNIQKIAGDIYVWKILKLRGKSEQFLVATRQGLYSFEYKKGQWQFKSKVKGYSEDSPYVAEGKNGDIWTSTPNGEVFRIKVNKELDKVESLKRYGMSEGLPNDFDNYVFAKKQGIILATEAGVYEYHVDKDKFEPNNKFNKMLGKQKQIKKVTQDLQGNIWFQKIETNTQTQKISYKTGVFFKQKDGTYKLLKNTYRLNERALESIISVDKNNVVFGTAIGGVFHKFDKKILINESKVFIRSVSANYGKKDTLFFQGNFRDRQNIVQFNQHEDSLLTIPYIFNDLTFNFATTGYISGQKNEYQFYLKGYDKDWSEWTKETQKSYTNLPEGTYTFYVKARNIYEQESNITSYKFVILAPWHRTIWAYAIYVLLAILFVWFLVRRVERRRLLLEKKVEAATLEARTERDKVLEQKQILEDANDSIQIQHKKIESQKKRIEKSLAQQKEQNILLQSQEEMLRYNMQQLEKTQRELNAQLEAIDKSAIIKTEYNSEGEILNINGAFTKVTGYEPKELIGKQHKEFISKGINEEDYTKFWEELRAGKSNTGEYKRYDKKGKSFWINSTYFPVRDEDGKIVKIISLAFDITESKTLLQEVQEQTTILQAQEEEMKQNMEVLLQTQDMMQQTQVELDGQLTAIDSSTVIKAEFDLNGYIVSANQAFLTFFAYQEEDIAEHLHHKMLVNPEYAYSFEYDYFWTSLTEGAKQPGEYLRINKEGKEVWLNATYTPVKNERGEVYKIIKLAFDITENKKLFNQIRERNTQLQEQEKIILKNIETLKSTQKQLEEQNRKIQQKNHQITASINYAQSIQNAILPTENQILNFFSECFILYLPKDIVSGDFYWYSQVEKEHFLAVVDCTGHGVPGAFMSMIGNTLLGDIVNSQRITDPAQILEKLNEGVRIKLKQEDTGNYDGMELALCKFQKENKRFVKVTFAGAKLPLYFFKNNELQQIKGTRKAIGGWQSDSGIQKQFENNILYLERGTQLYMSSDGFMDTANIHRKKIGSRGFRRILGRIYQKPDQIQKEFLKEALDIHQKGGEQRDDITVLGVRI